MSVRKFDLSKRIIDILFDEERHPAVQLYTIENPNMIQVRFGHIFGRYLVWRSKKLEPVDTNPVLLHSVFPVSVRLLSHGNREPNRFKFF